MAYTPKKPIKRSRKKKEKDKLTILDWVKIVLFVVCAAALISVFIFLKADIGNVADDYGQQASDLNGGKANSKSQFNKQFDYANEKKQEEQQLANQNGSNNNQGSTTYGNWDNLSGYYWGSYPIELFPLSVCGERGSSEEDILKCSGDGGKAYSLMQLDYRYDLVPFMKQAFADDPVAWKGFEKFLSSNPSDSNLIGNNEIIEAFNFCYLNYPDVYMKFMPNFFAERYLFNDGVKNILDKAGIDLENHSVFVAAALLSCNVNCGEITGTKNFISAGAKEEMSDEELLECVYVGWRMYRSNAKWAKHGARLASDKSGEEGMALKFIRGEEDVTTFNNHTGGCTWGAGWDGPNSVRLANGGSN